MSTGVDRERALPHGVEPSAAGRADGASWTPRRILVASRGSRTSDGALRVASGLARRAGGAIELVTVWQPEMMPPLTPTIRHPCECSDRKSVARLLRCARSQRRSVLGAAPHLPMRLIVGYPPLAIASAASASGADLIVLGLGRPDPEDRLRGDETALRLSYVTDVPVLAVPANALGPPGRLVVLVEQPAAAERAARMAAALASPGASVELMTADAAGGDVVSRLLALAESQDREEVIVLSLHGCTFEQRVVATTVVDRVLRAARTSVLLVPPERSAVSREHRVVPAAVVRGELSPVGIYQPGAVSRW